MIKHYGSRSKCQYNFNDALNVLTFESKNHHNK